MNENSRHRLLSGSQLKLIAVILMLIDHIHYFFEYTGLVPVFFTQIGRLSAPIFIFLLLEGFLHTRNRLKYFFQIYLLGAAMVFVRYFIALWGFYNADVNFPINGMLSTFAVIIAAYQGLEWIRSKKTALGIFVCVAVLLLPYLALNAARRGLWPTGLAGYMLEAFLPMHTLIPDGGTLMLVCGLALYFFKENRYLQALAFVLAGNGYYFYQVFIYVGSIEASELLYPYCQWMMMFAAVLFLLYNGKRGKSRLPKQFFYIFYPAHVYALYILACMLVPYFKSTI